ncbi:hypothetical protein H1S01_10735 [Heliobacterium chlorum]|uniref:Uncharacterized protein n=1 Tax=Heliobacterium chlorum TaxID=2698 RepID=A0ABR7T2I5_HELCL|nr:hypothetical protein [Heliobacterium chlorum]MBC9784984.1 hypothetical protein [Heliobacterium chlorum]
MSRELEAQIAKELTLKLLEKANIKHVAKIGGEEQSIIGAAEGICNVYKIVLRSVTKAIEELDEEEQVDSEESNDPLDYLFI